MKGLLRTCSPWKCFNILVLISLVSVFPLFLVNISLNSLYFLNFSIFSVYFSGVFYFSASLPFFLSKSAYEDSCCPVFHILEERPCPAKVPLLLVFLDEVASFADSEPTRSRDSFSEWWWWPYSPLFFFNYYCFYQCLTLCVLCWISWIFLAKLLNPLSKSVFSIF